MPRRKGSRSMFPKPLPPPSSWQVWLCCLLLTAVSAAKDNTVSRLEAQDGWLLLFDGDSLFGWTQQGGGHWRATSGVLVYDGSEDGLLRTDTPFSDFTMKVEFRGGDPQHFGGIFLRIGNDAAPQDSGYFLQLGSDSAKWPVGSVVPALKSDGTDLASGDWHAVEVEVVADHFAVKVDGKNVTDGKDTRSSAGYIALQGTAGSRMEFRNLKLKPVREKALFTGTDLSGWKAVNPAPQKPSGLKKLLKAGGKPKEADWSIVGGAIHSEHGVGQLETQTTYDDFLLQIAVRTNVQKKSEHGSTAIDLRGDPGQFSSGYQAGITMPGGTGGLSSLKAARKPLGTDNQFVTETIAARGRHFEIWVDGYPVTEYDDPRPESNSAQKGARTAAGPISIQAPLAAGSVDFQNVKIAALPKTLGGDMKAVAIAPVVAAAPAAVQSAPTAPPAAQALPGMAPMMAQMQQQQAKEEAGKKQVASLMVEALKSSDPKQQEQIYTNILSVDPNNMVAAQGLKDAQQKIQQSAAEQQRKEEQATRESQAQANKQANLSQALQNGQSSFLAGDLKGASSQIAIADKIAPADPRVQSLQARINQAVQARDRVRALTGIAVLAGLIGVIVLAWKSRGKKTPYLEVISGIEKGKRFGLDQEVNHIGAVAQDGGAKNEIVVKDVDRLVSRFHCEIHKKDGKLFLIDRNSANGTLLNGKRLKPGKPVALKNGGRVELARACALRLRFEKAKS